MKRNSVKVGVSQSGEKYVYMPYDAVIAEFRARYPEGSISISMDKDPIDGNAYIAKCSIKAGETIVTALGRRSPFGPSVDPDDDFDSFASAQRVAVISAIRLLGISAPNLLGADEINALLQGDDQPEEPPKEKRGRKKKQPVESEKVEEPVVEESKAVKHEVVENPEIIKPNVVVEPTTINEAPIEPEVVESEIIDVPPVIEETPIETENPDPAPPVSAPMDIDPSWMTDDAPSSEVANVPENTESNIVPLDLFLTNQEKSDDATEEESNEELLGVIISDTASDIYEATFGELLEVAKEEVADEVLPRIGNFIRFIARGTKMVQAKYSQEQIDAAQYAASILDELLK